MVMWLVRHAAAILLFSIFAEAAPCQATSETRLIAAGSIGADMRDCEGETVGGIGSAMEAISSGELVMLSDRGPGDGTIEYRPRLHFFSLERHGSALELKLARTILLRDSKNHAFTGVLPDTASEPPQCSDGRMCIDPEGLAVASDGRIYVAEEYMPSVREFDAEGKFVRRFPTPAEFIPRGSTGPDFAAEDEHMLVAGREPNRGFEGLALLPDGNLAAVLQSDLVQHGGRDSSSTRLVVYDTAKAEVKGIYLLPLSRAEEVDAVSPSGKRIKPRHLVVSELTALPDGRLLALERDNFGADGTTDYPLARWKAVVLLDLRGADNLLGRADAAGVTPIKRTVLFNLVAIDTAACGLPRSELPAKWEGLTVAAVEHSRLRLLLSSDNDFLTPELQLKRSSGELVSLPFPRAKRSQDTWILEIETALPDASAFLSSAEKSLKQ